MADVIPYETGSVSSAIKSAASSLTSSVESTLNSLTLNSVAGTTVPGTKSSSDYSNFRDWFYYYILTTAHNLPIPALWLVYFDNIPDTSSTIKSYEPGSAWSISNQSSLVKYGGVPGMIFAQGVQLPGDGITTSRLGPANMGLPKGIISENRNDYENIIISYLETNYSFTDAVLRPWSIMVGHNGLKDFDLRKTITIVQLAKNGAGNNLIERGKWTFTDACPISIDSQQYTYEGAQLLRRQVTFAYNYYNYEASIPSNIKPQSSVGMSWYTSNDSNSMLGSLLDRVTSAAVDLVAGTAENIVTNVTGSIEDAVENAITSVESQARGFASNLTSSITDAVNNAIDSITGADSDKDTSNGDTLSEVAAGESDTPTGTGIGSDYVSIKTVGTADRIKIYREPLQPIAVRNSPNTRIEVNIPTNDTPVFSQTQAPGEQIVVSTTKSAKQNMKDNLDTPIFFPGDGNTGKIKVPGSSMGASGGSNLDTPNTQNLIVQVRPVNKNDTVNGLTVASNEVTVNTNDTSNSLNLAKNEVNILANDTPGKISSISKSIKSEDTIKGSSVNVQNKSIGSNDHSSGKNIPIQMVTINNNDTRKG